MTFEIMYKKIGRQPLSITTKTPVMVYDGENDFHVNGLNYENGKLIGLKATKVCCKTCKNNVEEPPPHTCDFCDSLDTPDYFMWESK